MKSKKIRTIVCPRCGAQYLPGEIYLPKAFLGQPTNIVKDYRGHILDFNGDTMDTREQYICDKCDTKFTVRATVQFYTDYKAPISLKQSVKLKSDKLELPE